MSRSLRCNVTRRYVPTKKVVFGNHPRTRLERDRESCLVLREMELEVYLSFDDVIAVGAPESCRVRSVVVDVIVTFVLRFDIFLPTTTTRYSARERIRACK